MELIGLISLFSIQLILILWMIYDYKKAKLTSDKIQISGLSVLIPFRNETNRIHDLIESFNAVSLLDKVEFIFIDDHSTDDTVEKIRQKLKVPYQLLQLKERKGKKWAIDLGVEQAKYDTILTLDADVSFHKNFFKSILKLPKYDLIVLPVRMQGKSWTGKLSSFEFNWLQLLTFFTLTGKKPILCNGANLLFNKNAYLEVKKERKDFDIPSGDDIFLLDAFIKKKKSIIRYADAQVLVKTIALDSIKKLVIQRKRWIGKMNKKISFSMVLALFIMFLTQIGLFMSIYWSFGNLLFLIPIGIKIIAESLIQIFLQPKLSSLSVLGLTIYHQIWYPVFVLLMVIPFKDKGRWGR